ncbi:MAG: GntR family transcriptional regulator [Proteobacteria bacterium]|nr:GntR family transcriptional regulator [Pseudomonadota bacterium]
MSENMHGNRTQVVTTRLRQMIVAGDLAPGQRISEREIGEHLDGISRTPLREAFKILAAEGLVTISPNRGASVTALSMAEVEDTIELLVGLEGLAAEPACARISEQDLAAIDELHQRMGAAYRAEQLMEYFELNQAIHQHIVDAAGNRVLSRVYAAECARIRRYRYAGNRRHERWDRALAEHQQILGALKARNGSLLRELLCAHHHNGWQISRALVEREFAADATVAS